MPHPVEFDAGMSSPFRIRVRVAAESGILLGVKYGVALVLIAVAIGLLLADYAATRQNAAFAAGYIRDVIKQQQSQGHQ
jgi:hypothetical protein